MLSKKNWSDCKFAKQIDINKGGTAFKMSVSSASSKWGARLLFPTQNRQAGKSFRQWRADTWQQCEVGY